jgi:prevent-host-death family protein
MYKIFVHLGTTAMTNAIRISITQFRDQLAAYIDLAQKGQEVVLTNHGKSVAKLGPTGDGLSRKPGILKGKIGPIPDDAWDTPEDIIAHMEGRTA